MSLHLEIEKRLEDLGFSIPPGKSPYGTYNGKWRYHNWECDSNPIWGISFNGYKVESEERYIRDIEAIKTYEFKGCNLDGYDSLLVKITEKNIDMAFKYISKLLSLDMEVKNFKKEIRSFNHNDKKLIRDKKLEEVLK